VIKAIIFDCFGVVITDGFEDAYRRMGGDPEQDKEFIRAAMRKSDTGQVPTSIPLIAEHLGIADEVWHDAVNDGRVINHELLEYVKELRGTYKIAMLSNIGSAGVRRFFPENFLEQHFDEIVESGVIGFAKPEARAYEVTADRLGVRLDECVFTDDRQEYIDGAVAVGMRAFLYEGVEKLKKDLEKILTS
jgi:HAD superfamily hydrolase (TIGR01509 family)